MTESLTVSLIIKDNVREPDVLTGNMKVLHASVSLGVPGQLVVGPLLLHPDVGGEYLPPHVLQRQHSQSAHHTATLYNTTLTTPIT